MRKWPKLLYLIKYHAGDRSAFSKLEFPIVAARGGSVHTFILMCKILIEKFPRNLINIAAFLTKLLLDLIKV